MTKNEKKNRLKEKKMAKTEKKKQRKASQDTLKEQYSNLGFAYKFIWQRNKKLFLYRIPLLIIQSVQTLIPIFFVRTILNELTIGRNIRKVLLYALGMAISIFGIKLLNSFFGVWDSREREKLGFSVSKHLAESVMEMTYSSLEDPEMQDFVWLAMYNRFDSVLYFSTAVASSLLTVFGIGSVVFALNPFILGVIIVSAVVRFFIDKYQRKLPQKYNDERKRADRRTDYYMAFMEEGYSGKEVRTNNLEDWLCEKAEDSWENGLLPLDLAFHRKNLMLQSITGIVGMIQDILIYLFLAIEVVNSSMTVGDFSMYLTAASTFSSCILGISGNYSNLMIQTAWYLKDYRKCLSIAEKQKSDGGKMHIGVPENVEIEFRDVSFKYPKTERMILEHVNITIKRDETLSIVGANGAGKTTFVKLLCRFYEPTEGEILINGISTRDIPLTEYYNLLGVVFQDFNIFEFKFSENISMDTECDMERLKDSIRKCGLEKRVGTLPNGVDTYIYKTFDPDGIELSGGEGQKIAIARAIYRGAPIVIFDEPTSSLDPIAEYDIYRNFHDLSENRTAIYISHRMSSTRFTDKTAVFVNGTITEYGTHQELYAQGGVYTDMFNRQAQFYRE